MGRRESRESGTVPDKGGGHDPAVGQNARRQLRQSQGTRQLGRVHAQIRQGRTVAGKDGVGDECIGDGDAGDHVGRQRRIAAVGRSQIPLRQHKAGAGQAVRHCGRHKSIRGRNHWRAHQVGIGEIGQAAAVAKDGAGQIGGGLGSRRAHADDVLIPGDANVADIDVAAAGHKVDSRLIAHGDVVVAIRVVFQRGRADGRVVAAAGVVFHRESADGRVEAAARVDIQHPPADARVVGAVRVEQQDVHADSRVLHAVDVVFHRVDADSRVVDPARVFQQRQRPDGRVVGAARVGLQRGRAEGGVGGPVCVGFQGVHPDGRVVVAALRRIAGGPFKIVPGPAVGIPVTGQLGRRQGRQARAVAGKNRVGDEGVRDGDPAHHVRGQRRIAAIGRGQITLRQHIVDARQAVRGRDHRRAHQIRIDEIGQARPVPAEHAAERDAGGIVRHHRQRELGQRNRARQIGRRQAHIEVGQPRPIAANGARQIRGGLAAADADEVRIRSHARIADVNVAAAGHKEISRQIAHGNIVAAGGVLIQRSPADGRVVGTAGIKFQGLLADTDVVRAARVGIQHPLANGRVESAARVGLQRARAHGRVVGAARVGIQHSPADARVIGAVRVEQQDVHADSRVFHAVDVVFHRVDADGRVIDPARVLQQRQRPDGRVESAARVGLQRGRAKGGVGGPVRVGLQRAHTDGRVVVAALRRIAGGPGKEVAGATVGVPGADQLGRTEVRQPRAGSREDGVDDGDVGEGSSRRQEGRRAG